MKDNVTSGIDPPKVALASKRILETYGGKIDLCDAHVTERVMRDTQMQLH